MHCCRVSWLHRQCMGARRCCLLSVSPTLVTWPLLWAWAASSLRAAHAQAMLPAGAFDLQVLYLAISNPSLLPSCSSLALVASHVFAREVAKILGRAVSSGGRWTDRQTHLQAKPSSLANAVPRMERASGCGPADRDPRAPLPVPLCPCKR